MSSMPNDVYSGALRTAHDWLTGVAEELGTSDGHAANRVLRAWLHTLRDRLPVASAVNFAAQLPEVLRGVFYEGWQPGRVPVKYGEAEYCLRFAQEALIPPEQVPEVAPRWRRPSAGIWALTSSVCWPSCRPASVP